ncbi:Altered inheritance of mitochondria protein 32, partial [Ascosphaera acerosa]
MPAGLEIDHAQPLNGTMAAYSQHLLVASGRADWASRIEDGVADEGVVGEEEAEGWLRLTRGVKGLLGRGGRFMD